ncbi:MAG TPA: acyl-CoA dehydrogenase [Steroidobacteraceae bacterium]|jgi:alkylation response protein AidB-like acyl-CoA dehydrogenase
MDFDLTQSQTLLNDALRRFLGDRYPVEERHRIAASADGWSPNHWRGFADELGLLGLALPESNGGMGAGATETMIVMDALGEALVIEPYLETMVIGVGFLKRSPGSAAHALLTEIAAGRARLAFACGEARSRYALQDVSTTAQHDGSFWQINGMKNVVSAAPFATHLIVSARTLGQPRDREGISLFLVNTNTAGLSMYPYRTIDDRRAADVQFDLVRLPNNALLGEPGTALPLIELVMDEAIAALCAEAAGVMRRLLTHTIEYTQQRRQFGQTIAQFQALQHRIADMYMALEQACSAVYLATLKLDRSPRERALAVSAAKATIGNSGRFIGQNAVQLHGGIGMTQELAVGNYFKRLTVIENQFGTVDYHLARYAALSRIATA